MELPFQQDGGNLDPNDIPAVVEIYSKAAGKWFVGLVVKQDEMQRLLTIRFLDDQNERKEKVLSYDAPEVDYFGAHLGWPTPSGVISVPSTTRKGQVSYLDPELKQKFATPELAWQAYLEHHLRGFTALDTPWVESPSKKFAAAAPAPAASWSGLERKISANCAKSLDRSDLPKNLFAAPASHEDRVPRSLEEELAAARFEAMQAVRARHKTAASQGVFRAAGS